MTINFNNKWLLILISAVSYNLALIYPDVFGFLCLIFLIPIFYLANNNKLDFFSGFIWGIIFNSIHFYFLINLLYKHGNGLFKYMAPIVLIIYFSLISGIWFYLLGALKFLNQNLSALKTALITWLYFLFIYKYAFIIFFIKNGYVLNFPLLPIINKLNYLGVVNFELLLLCLIILILLTIKEIKNLKILIIIIFFMWFFTPDKDSKKCNFDNLEQIYTSNFIDCSPYRVGYEIKKAITETIKLKPDTNILVLTESSCAFPLNKYPEIINSWYKDLKNKNMHIIVGSHYKVNNKTYNTVYHLYNSKIVNIYNKTCLVPFAEYLPYNFQPLFIKNLLLKESKEFSKGKEDKKSFRINNIKIFPYICSDIFLNKKIPDNNIIFLFLNESWFSNKYIINLMKLFIQLKSIELNCEIFSFWKIKR